MRVVLPGDRAFPYQGPGWDLREEPPEEGPVITYRLSPEEIAARYGPPRPRPKATGMTGVAYDPRLAKPMRPMTIDVLRRLAAEGLTAEEIAERLGRSVAGVRHRAQQWGVKLVEPGEEKQLEGRKEQPANWEEELRRLFLVEGRTVAEIARRYGVSETTVRYYLKKCGIARGSAGTRGTGRGGPQARGSKQAGAQVGLSLARVLPPDEASSLVQRVAEVLGGVSGLVPAVRVEIRVEAAEQ